MTDRFDPEQDRRNFKRFGVKLPTNYNQLKRTPNVVDEEYEELIKKYNIKWHKEHDVVKEKEFKF